jgi:hypothetical protein
MSGLPGCESRNVIAAPDALWEIDVRFGMGLKSISRIVAVTVSCQLLPSIVKATPNDTSPLEKHVWESDGCRQTEWTENGTLVAGTNEYLSGEGNCSGWSFAELLRDPMTGAPNASTDLVLDYGIKVECGDDFDSNRGPQFSISLWEATSSVWGGIAKGDNVAVVLRIDGDELIRLSTYAINAGTVMLIDSTSPTEIGPIGLSFEQLAKRLMRSHRIAMKIQDEPTKFVTFPQTSAADNIGRVLEHCGVGK